jgi:hypothetical protein
MTSTKIFKLYYIDSSNNKQILGYLNELTQILHGHTGPNINGSISLYEFTDTQKPKSHIYLTNAEYTPNIYAIGFWFAVNGTSNYTLLNILSPEYRLTVSNKILSDSVSTFSIQLPNDYNMCALVFEANKLTKIVVNNDNYPLTNSIPIPNTSGSVGIALGNDNNMGTKFNGYIGEIQLLNANSFINGEFNIDTLYSKLKYKKTTLPTTTLPTTTLPTTIITPSNINENEDGIKIISETTITQPVTPIIQPNINENEDGLKIISATTPQTTIPTPTSYIPTTTSSPIDENTALLIKL